MTSHLIVRGKKIHVEIFGQNHLPAVLFLHGGPGESCYEFVYYQARRLSKELKVIAIDQRGVLRSERIGDDESFGMMDIIEDCEDIRLQLGIKEWAIIGHSFGGYLALVYTKYYPQSVSKVVFENPTFDFEWTARNLLKCAGKLFLSKGDKKHFHECEEYANGFYRTEELFDHYLRLGEILGDEKEKIYSPNQVATDDSVYTDEEWEAFSERTDVHLRKLREEGRMFESIIPYLSELHVPSLLLVGEYDPVTCDKHINEYNQVKKGKIVEFKGCGHMLHSEEPDRYREVVTDFIKER
ncbi:alpha/beta fold hydrolase [Bacillus chungangensis]|uniref:Proline iminopeptidase n=1 Tax=Bacillus chungangensis TaxID=587633 RepID=A0ABT9WQG0_9BACI|nr:alpha/beta hydrolase [Bacillus chungangensis]MDQ0175522.1 proline iminopeptidase [Bacillus chungangensis]